MLTLKQSIKSQSKTIQVKTRLLTASSFAFGISPMKCMKFEQARIIGLNVSNGISTKV